MKNRVALLLTILLASGLWAFAQVEPQPKPQPQPQPQPQPRPQPAATPAPPGDVVEIRIDDPAGDFTRKAQYERTFAVQAARDATTAWKQKTEKGSYIGLGTSPIPNVLRDQLKLPAGSGLVVDRVEGNSPAEAAGMKISDIIQKLDDQTLINPHQFGVLVRNLKPDVEVKLSIIRETKPQTVAIKPVEKDLAPLDETAGYGAVNPWIDANTRRTV
ncbi:MAG TPA: PDZ domain-containing protein, partial [Tepidisphaeraceae bacterium]|nr:PDZ domain-containing protein [Tepidisphaeraceae bacterium]